MQYRSNSLLHSNLYAREPPPSRTLRIGELAARTGLTAPTIRYYEQIGLLPGGPRPHRSHRIYTEADVDRLDLLRRLRDLLGVSLDELQEIAAAEETAAALPARIGGATSLQTGWPSSTTRSGRPTGCSTASADGRPSSSNSSRSSRSVARDRSDTDHLRRLQPTPASTPAHPPPPSPSA